MIDLPHRLARLYLHAGRRPRRGAWPVPFDRIRVRVVKGRLELAATDVRTLVKVTGPPAAGLPEGLFATVPAPLWRAAFAPPAVPPIAPPVRLALEGAGGPALVVGSKWWPFEDGVTCAAPIEEVQSAVRKKQRPGTVPVHLTELARVLITVGDVCQTPVIEVGTSDPGSDLFAALTVRATGPDGWSAEALVRSLPPEE